MEEYEIQSGEDEYVRFTGIVIGESTSDDGDRLRWQEITIYRTENGNYIAQRVGRSLVFHRPDGCEQGDLVTDDDGTVGLLPCPVCEPSPYLKTFRLEVDRHTVHISKTPGGIVESLTSEDEDGVRYRPRVVQAALREAAQNDIGMKGAMQTQLVS